MVNDDRNLLELLKDELEFIEQGGYGRSVRTPWKEKSAFQDSLTCINYGYPYRAHACSECHLIDFVAPADRTKDIPCHHIPLNAKGETIQELETEENQHKLEEQVKEWLRSQIRGLEEKQSLPVDQQAPLGSAESEYCCKS
jgi:hypothetical protein